MGKIFAIDLETLLEEGVEAVISTYNGRGRETSLVVKMDLKLKEITGYCVKDSIDGDVETKDLREAVELYNMQIS